MHDGVKMGQRRAKPAARVEGAELLGIEALVLEQGDRNGIAERKLEQGGGRWRQTDRAGFRRLRHQQDDIGFGRERAPGVGGDGDERHREAARIGEDILQFDRLAGIGHHDHHVIGGDHAKIAMARFGRMNEHGRRAGRGQGCGDLAGDIAALADAGEDDAAARPLDRVDGRADGVAKGAVEGRQKLSHAFVFDRNGAPDRGKPMPLSGPVFIRALRLHGCKD